MLFLDLSGPAQKPQTHTFPTWPRMLRGLPISLLYPFTFFPDQLLLSLFMRPTMCLFIYSTKHCWAPGWAKHWGKPHGEQSRQTLCSFGNYSPAGITEQSAAIKIKSGNASCYGNTQYTHLSQSWVEWVRSQRSLALLSSTAKSFTPNIRHPSPKHKPLLIKGTL